MNHRAWFTFVVFLLPGIATAAADPVGVRPYELEWADRREDTRPPLVDFEDLEGWSVNCRDAVAAFTPSKEQRIWGDYVGKLVYRADGSHPVVTIRCPQPLPITPPFDCVNLWVYGNNWAWVPDRSTPPVEIRVLLQSPDGTTVPVVLGGVRWKEWWLMHHRLSAEQLSQLGEAPQLIGVEVAHGRNRDDRVIYLDNLAVYQESLPPLEFEPRPRRNLQLPPGQTVGTNTGPGALPFPTREETILPSNLTDRFTTRLEQTGDAFTFHYEGEDGHLEYRYAPATGTLSDVAAQWTGRGNVLHPLSDGGVVLTGTDTGEPGVPPQWELVQCVREGDIVRARWSCVRGDTNTQVEYRLRLWQKSLVVDIQCDQAVVEEVTVGRVTGTENPRVVTVPYLTGAEARPGILVAGTRDAPLFASVLLDHCRSNASLFWFANKVGPEGVILNGGARYLPKTDGQRNPSYERLFLTISPRFEETLPNIPNPRSPWMHVAGERLWRAHGASDRQRDLELWQKVARYGMTKVAITDHETGWRDGGESFTMRTRAAPGKGGDEGQAEYARKLRGLGFRYGIYNNYTDYAPVNEHWDEDYVTRTSDHQWQTAWPRCYNPKPARAVELEGRLASIIQEKFQLDTAYCDVHTAVRPWSYCDFDARVPGAGTFAATFYAYGEIMLHQKATWHGPVYSEGNNHWYYCGLTDGNYGQDQLGQLATSPWLVDFDLRKLHPLCCNFGMGNLGMFYGEHQQWGTTPAERQARLDRFLAATLAFGHTGFLVMEGGFQNAVQSYYCLQQVHARYACQEVDSIRYADADGHLLDTSAAVASDAYRRSQILTRYRDGMEVYVNGHESEAWQTPHALLPPNGWYARDEAGSLAALSALVDGHRADYVDSPAYIYANGRGTLTRFPRAVCDGPLIAIHREDGTVELIPLADCHVAAVDLGGRSATAVALDASGKPLGPVTTRDSRGLIFVTSTPEATSYLLTPASPPAGRVQCARVQAVPGETVTLQTEAGAATCHIPADASPGTLYWHPMGDQWIDFTVTPLVRAELDLPDGAYALRLTSNSDRTLEAEVTLGPQTRRELLQPNRELLVNFPRPAAEKEGVQELPLAVTAGELRFQQTWWINTEYRRAVLTEINQFADSGQRLRGEPEKPLDALTNANTYWTERSCGDDLRRCLFAHPPYTGGVGYTFVRTEPIQLPDRPVMAFRCDVGKADGSDLGDGIVFRVAAVQEDGREELVAETHCREHAWTALTADLAPWRGTTVTLKLISDAGPADNSSGDWGCWSKMRIESQEPELETDTSTYRVVPTRDPAPFAADKLTLADIRSARSAVLHFQAIGLERRAPYVSTAGLNEVELGDLPAAGGDEQRGQWADAQLTIPAQAIAELQAWNVLTLQNPGHDSFKVRRFWMELVLADGRRAASEITNSVFTQPATWLHAEGTGVPFEQDIRLELHIPLSKSN